jgi:hypothetical protein
VVVVKDKEKRKERKEKAIWWEKLLKKRQREKAWMGTRMEKSSLDQVTIRKGKKHGVPGQGNFLVSRCTGQ